MLKHAPAIQRGTLASLVLVRVYKTLEVLDKEEPRRRPLGYVFVKNEKEFGPGALYKLAGGHGTRGERAKKTAVRELRQETNLQPNKGDFEYFGRWLEVRDHGSHWKYLFAVDIDEQELRWMSSTALGNDGEVPRFFTTDEFYALVRAGRFMEDQYRKLVEYAAILPFGADR